MNVSFLREEFRTRTPVPQMRSPDMTLGKRGGVQHTVGVRMETQLNRQRNEALHARPLPDLFRRIVESEARGFGRVLAMVDVKDFQPFASHARAAPSSCLSRAFESPFEIGSISK